MPSTKIILTTSIVVGGGLWALLKIYNHLRGANKKVVRRLQLKPQEAANTSVKPLLNDTSSVFEKRIDVPSYKGFYLIKYAKSTLRKYEVCSGARIHVELSPYENTAHYHSNDELVTSRSQIKIVGTQSQIYMAESYLNEILAKITYKIVIISCTRFKKMRQKKRLDIAAMESSTKTMIKWSGEQPEKKTNKTTDGYNLGAHNDNEKFVTFYVFGRRKDVSDVAGKIDGSIFNSTVKQSTPTDKKNNSIAREFAEECLEVTKNVWSESSRNNSASKANTTATSSSSFSSSSRQTTNNSSKSSDIKKDNNSPNNKSTNSSYIKVTPHAGGPPKSGAKINISISKSSAKERRIAKNKQ